ncbi:YisL family protein [Lentilactobacillus raoultii]|uniref:YisL family protein n=1 Tax=Lentilactobacillus raoultii TaxID=1987503 RepID=A0ABW3PP67_9LACO|nr:YisL family protein [Lentilactobacillus raoultii]
MFWLWIHLITWVVLTIVVIAGLAVRSANVMPWAMTARILYLIAIISGVILLWNTWQYNPVLSAIKVILALGLIAFIEIAFARKQENKFHRSLIWWACGFCILVGAVGLILSQGRPFLH